MRWCFSQRSFSSGFQIQHIVLCKKARDGTMVTQCLSKVSGLEGARRQTNTSSSRLEVVCSREQFEDWSPLVDMMRDFQCGEGSPMGAQDGIVRGRPRKEPTPPHPPFLVGESTQKHNTGIHDITDELGGRHSAGGHSGSGEETDDRNEVPMNESLPSDGQSQSSGGRTIETIASQRQPQLTPMECDKV